MTELVDTMLYANRMIQFKVERSMNRQKVRQVFLHSLLLGLQNILGFLPLPKLTQVTWKTLAFCPTLYKYHSYKRILKANDTGTLVWGSSCTLSM